MQPLDQRIGYLPGTVLAVYPLSVLVGLIAALLVRSTPWAWAILLPVLTALGLLYRRFGRSGIEISVFSCGGMRAQQSWSRAAAVSDAGGSEPSQGSESV